MCMKILVTCTACGACEPECPDHAIHRSGGRYAVDRRRCGECIGFHDSPRCQQVCPVEGGIILDPDFVGLRDVLQIQRELSPA